MSDAPTPEQVPLEDGHVCYTQNCFKPATWKVGTKYRCYDHMAMAGWLPFVPKHWTGPRGKKNQLKIPFPEVTHGEARQAGEDRDERQGEEGAQSISAGRAGGAVGTGEEGVSVDGRQIDDTGEQLGQEFASLADSDEAGKATRAGGVPEVPGRDREEGSPEEEADFGTEEWDAEGEPGRVSRGRR